jgi:hypothetical protein
METDQEAISRSLNDWGWWLRTRLPPIALFLLGVAFGRWVTYSHSPGVSRILGATSYLRRHSMAGAVSGTSKWEIPDQS